MSKTKHTNISKSRHNAKNKIALYSNDDLHGAPANACIKLLVVTSGHVTKMAAAPSAISENPMLHAQIWLDAELWLIKVIYCGNTRFSTFFAHVTLTLTR